MNQSQCLDHLAVRVELFSFHVIQQFASSNIKGVQSTLRVFILLVLTEVRLNLLNTSGQSDD